MMTISVFAHSGIEEAHHVARNVELESHVAIRDFRIQVGTGSVICCQAGPSIEVVLISVP